MSCPVGAAGLGDRVELFGGEALLGHLEQLTFLEPDVVLQQLAEAAQVRWRSSMAWLDALAKRSMLLEKSPDEQGLVCTREGRSEERFFDQEVGRQFGLELHLHLDPNFGRGALVSAGRGLLRLLREHETVMVVVRQVTQLGTSFHEPLPAVTPQTPARCGDRG